MEADPQGEWLLMVDGAARGNPGEAGCGAVICDENGKTLQKLSRYLGRTTNNVAEYEGLILGLRGILKLGGRRVRVQSDSELLVRQLNGIYRVRDIKLKSLSEKVFGLLQQLQSYRIIHVRREHNSLADELANQAIDREIRKRSSG